jgi:regulation of enolase protein 1 (concanavalin A-like superfamily)
MYAVMNLKPISRWCLALLTLYSTARAEQVVISEIHYHPRSTQPEYVEIYNNTATPFDIAQWKLTGGVSFEFPDFSDSNPTRTFLQPFERIVLSSASETDTRRAYGLVSSIRVFGPWNGDLANDGERLTLLDKNGANICSVAYGDNSPWPVAADGGGHSLVLVNPDKAIDSWHNWAASQRPGGTPGTLPVADPESPVPNPEITTVGGLTVVDFDHEWAYYDRAATGEGDGWNQPGFVPGRLWRTGPGLFGFETASLPAPGIQTPFTDVDQITYYLTTTFSFSGDTSGVSLVLDQILDDGAVYYLNGTEIGRSRMPSGEITYTTTANSVGNATLETNVFGINASLLQSGLNTLAVEVHQTGPTSSDVVFGARLTVIPPSSSPSGIVINEILPGATGEGFVEFFNPDNQPVNLQGFHLTQNLDNTTDNTITQALIVPAQGFASVGFAEIGLTPENPQSVYLLSPDGLIIENGLRAEIPPDGRSLGRKPAGSGSWFLFSQPTRNAPNQSQSSAAGLVRINEVLFNPDNTTAWIELINLGPDPANLASLYLASDPDLANATQLSGSLNPGQRTTVNASFSVNDAKLELWLTDTTGTVWDAHRIRRPLGRDSVQAYPEGSTEWFATTNPTPNAANAPDLITDVVINEIMFDPPSDERDGEFIELFNRGNITIDLSNWQFTDGINFQFPSGTFLAAGEYLVVAANAPRLQAVHNNLNVLGNFEGRLANKGERIRLVDSFGNLADEVDYLVGGDWPELTQGDGSSMELAHPWLDNSLPSAWRDSDESSKSSFRQYSTSGTYRQLSTIGGTSDYRELHFHLAGDGHVILQNIRFSQSARSENMILNGTSESTDNRSSSGWLMQGTHWASHLNNGQLHLISDGHGDNRPNRAEIDLPNIATGTDYTLSFDARWISGTPRLIGQTWDHSIGDAFRLEIPENLGTPGQPNSTLRPNPPPQIDHVIHSPAVPGPGEPVLVTAHIQSASPLQAINLRHRQDNSSGSNPWLSTTMYDDGLRGGDEVANDGIYTAELTQYGSNSTIVEFYVEATASNESTQLPKHGPDRPALYVVDGRNNPDDLRLMRFVVSAHDRSALSNGDSAAFNYKFPRLSNHYFNATLIVNESQVLYNAEIRNSGSPWTRSTDLSRGKWKLPGDRLFRNHQKQMFDNDPTTGNMHNNRATRYLLYLLGHPVNENEFVRLVINSGSPSIKEETEPVGNDLLDRVYENGSDGELYRIDDEWWFSDTWSQNSANATWTYKNDDREIRYHTEWMRRTREDDYDYTALINLFRTIAGTNGRGGYTQEQIERHLDPNAMLMMAAVRGYIHDWDSITLNRGKNGYMYRRNSDGLFQFFHWDSDLAWRSGDIGSALYSGTAGVGGWLSKAYNRRRFYHYVTLLLDYYTRNSTRTATWLQLEEDANNSFTVDRNRYLSWFNGRESYCISTMGSPLNLPLAITTNNGSPISSPDETLSLSGTCSYRVFDVLIEGHPEATITWADSLTPSWTASGITLHNGSQTLIARGIDAQGRIVETTTINVQFTGQAAPQMDLKASPASWHANINQSVTLDARNSLDPNASTLTFGWQPPSNLNTFFNLGDGRALASFNHPGLYPFTVTATNAAGATSTITRELSVYGPDGFSSFSDSLLEPFWTLAAVDYRSNSSQNPWFTLADIPGKLLIQLPDGTPALPWTRAGEAGPVRLHRPIPSQGDWALETELELGSRQFGDFAAGLEVHTDNGSTQNAYAIVLKDGTDVAVMHLTNGTTLTLATLPITTGQARIRIQRHNGNLLFETRDNEVWSTLHTIPIDSTTAITSGGLLITTPTEQSAQFRFDYVMLVDPSNTSDLRQHLRISEIMYNPTQGDSCEFVELLNTGSQTLQLNGASFVNGIQYTFPPTLLNPGQHILVAANPTTLAALHPNLTLPLAPGAFTGRLDNGGETLTLVDAEGNLIQEIRYGDSGDWPERADGYGASLEINPLVNNPNDPSGWNSSREFNGSPGFTGVGPFASATINEVLTHTDPPLEDAIELHNPTTQTIDLSGWFLSDDILEPRKFQFPNGTILNPNAYLVVYELQLNTPALGGLIPFQLDSAHGDDVWLTAADTSGNLTYFIDHVAFGASQNGVSFGRYPNGTGDLTAMASLTFGANTPDSLDTFRTGTGEPNTLPLVGPIVFSQLYYDALPGDDEFIELLNITGDTIPLYDPNHTTNTWHLNRAVDFVFPENVSLAPASRLLIVPVTPEDYLATHEVPADTQVFGPYVGALDNNGETLELYRPDNPQTSAPDAGFVPQILVEKVRYDNRAPWPSLAASLGTPILRINPLAYANTPSNWMTDFDADSMSDDWEANHLLSPFYADDAAIDSDGDGWINAIEHQYSSNPWDPTDALRGLLRGNPDQSPALQFIAQPGWSYDVLAFDNLSGQPTLLHHEPAGDTSRIVEITDPTPTTTTTRFYQIRATQPQ